MNFEILPNEYWMYQNEFLEGLSDVLDFRLEYIPQGYGCGLKFSLVSNYNGNE